MSQCRQTTCRHCGQDIEGLWPYRAGEWRDRGNNATCPHPMTDGRKHAPTLPTRRAPYQPKTARALNAHDLLLLALQRLLASPALNLDELEPEDHAAIDFARETITEVQT